MIEVENEEWIDDDNDIQLVFTIAQINEEDQILNSIENNEPSLYCDNKQDFFFFLTKTGIFIYGWPKPDQAIQFTVSNITFLYFYKNSLPF